MDLSKKEIKQIFNRENVIIFGGAGFIGSHLCDLLVKDYNVICIDDFSTGMQENIEHLLRNPNFIFIKHDITEPLVLEETKELNRLNLEVTKISYIYNLACPTSPKNFEKHKLETVRANSIGIYNTLELARKYNSKYLLASSSVIYGGAEEGGFIFNEKTIGCVDNTSPRACYDEGKRFAETICLTYKEQFNLDIKIARIFRTYGPRMPLSDGHMIPDFIANALDNKPLIIYGDENFASSFCYVSDIVNGLVRLMNSNKVDIVNLGSPDNYLIKDIAKFIIALLGSTSEIQYEAPLSFMRPLGLPDISLAREKLSWFPVVTMSEGLKRTVEYTLAHKDLIRFKPE